MNLNQERLAGLLKLYEEFEQGDEIALNYDHSSMELVELREKYKIEEVVKRGDIKSKVLNLLLWVATNVNHYGEFDNHIEQNSLSLMEYAFGNPDQGINCRGLSTILSECLLAIGIKARIMFLMPFSPYDCDNHVVVEAYIPESNKWIMIDPTYNSYFMNKEGEILSALEARECFANKIDIQVNDTLFYNDMDISVEELQDYYLEYMSKNLFYLKCNINNTFYAEKAAKFIYVYPKGFDIKMARSINHAFRVERFKDNPTILKWLEKVHDSEEDYRPRSYRALSALPEGV